MLVRTRIRVQMRRRWRRLRPSPSSYPWSVRSCSARPWSVCSLSVAARPVYRILRNRILCAAPACFADTAADRFGDRGEPVGRAVFGIGEAEVVDDLREDDACGEFADPQVGLVYGRGCVPEVGEARSDPQGVPRRGRRLGRFDFCFGSCAQGCVVEAPRGSPSAPEPSSLLRGAEVPRIVFHLPLTTLSGKNGATVEWNELVHQ